MKVALVVGQLSAGGTERQVHTLAEALHGTAVKPVVVSLTDRLAPFGTRLRESGVQVLALDAGSGVFGRVQALSRLLRDSKVDLVHSFGDAPGAFSTLAARLNRLLHVHSVRSGRYGRPTWSHLLRAVVVRRADAVTANSARLRDSIVESHRLPPSRVYLTPNGVDPSRFSRSDPVDLPGGLGMIEAPRVAYVGRDHPAKDLPTLVEVIRRVDGTWPERRAAPCFALVGPGLHGHAARLAAALRVVTVRHLGVTDDVDRVIAACDVLLLTSRSEGMPNAVLEGMAAGKPVVASAAGGVPELIADGITGRLAPVGAAGALAAALTELLQDDEARRALGDRARLHARRHASVDAARDAVIAVYDDLLVEALPPLPSYLADSDLHGIRPE